MYKFNMNAVDGSFTKEVTDLKKFIKEWIGDNWIDSSYIVTNDGVNTIMPADDATYQALEKERKIRNMTFHFDKN